MKYLLTSVFLLLGSLGMAANYTAEQDSLVILFGNKTRLVIHSIDRNGIRELTNYDINKIIRDMGMKLDSADAGNTFVVMDRNNTVRYLQDTVLVVTRGEGNVTVTVREHGNEQKRSSDKRFDKEDEDYSVRPREYRKNHSWSRWSVFGASIGLNTLIEQNALSAYPVESYELRPIGSRYFNLSLGQLPTIVRGKTVAFKLYYGVEVAWNNFMFDGNTRMDKRDNGVIFYEGVDANGNVERLDKSKLTVCTIGIPFVPRVSFYNPSGRRVFHIGVGPYVNYRIDSYTKVKPDNMGADRSHSNFHLNDFRYGMMMHLGLARVNFFAKYDLSPLFKDNLGPDVRVASFGISL
ncbi:outer membrane beta-barrel protein [Tellurirhabdus bombi]|uniref:outer membrane beta-barrel protein n=1 Tax=Tellurirhabdus bombi TaxID=2907205 RepID=UPI001F3F2A6E|nr:outer membrane beta-barrel protein [Tellurirhabdus bombi]